MPPIPTTLLQYGPAGLTLVVSAALAWSGRTRKWLRPGVSMACLLGWAALEPLTRWRAAAATPGLAPAMLLVPAAGVVALEAIRVWRAGRNCKLISFLAACLTGWWLAQVVAQPHEAWRIGILVAGLTGLVAAIIRQRPAPGLAMALALWGGLAMSGLPAGWVVAAAVLAAGWAALLAMGASAAVPSALVAATLAGADLTGGRLSRGHLEAADFACLLALAAPFGAGFAAARLGKRWQALAPVLGAAAAIALAVVLPWGLRRIVVS